MIMVINGNPMISQCKMKNNATDINAPNIQWNNITDICRYNESNDMFITIVKLYNNLLIPRNAVDAL